MKRILLVIMAVCILLCFVGCNDEAENNSTTTTTAATTAPLNNADANKAGLARIGFDAFMNYLNMCAAYNVPVEVNENDTIKAIADRLIADGSDIEINNINENAKYFDYAMENPNYGSGGGMYLIREDADWLALYVD